MMLPLLMTAMRSQRRSATSMTWVEKKTVFPAWLRLPHDLLEVEGGLRVEAHHGLVEDPVGGVGKEARHDAELLLHAAAVAAYGCGEHVRDAETLGQAVGALAALRVRHAVDVRDEVEVLVGPEAAEKLGVVAYVAEAGLGLEGLAGQVEPVDRDRTGIRGQGSRQ